MNYKLAVFDLDGTLLNPNKVLTPRVLEALRRAISCDLKVTVSTGRTLPSARPYIDAMGIDGPVSFQNGALIASLRPLELHRLVIFPRDKMLEAVNFAKETELYVMLFTPLFEAPYMFMERAFPHDSHFRFYFEKSVNNAILVDDIFDALKRDTAFNELVVVGKVDKIYKFIDRFRESGLSLILNSFAGDEAFLEVYGPGCSKEISLLFFSEYYNIPLDQIIFVGDNHNDLDAIRCAGLGVAMGNAPEEVKGEADLVIPSNEDDGVACLLDEILKNGEELL